MAQPRVVCTAMAGTHKTSTLGMKIHRTPRVRASAAVRLEFALTQAQQHSRIISCWVVEVEAGTRHQQLCAFDLPCGIRDQRILGSYTLRYGRRRQQESR